MTTIHSTLERFIWNLNVLFFSLPFIKVLIVSKIFFVLQWFEQ